MTTWPHEPTEPMPPVPPIRPGWPLPPERPLPGFEPATRRQHPVMVPIVDLPRSRPTDQRRVMVSGALDADTATRVAAELMELDGRSPDAVELVINSDGGPLGEVLAVLDVIGSMRAPVRTVCLGRATGSAAVLLASGTGGRRAGSHATISLRCAQVERIEGSPSSLRAQLEDLERTRSLVVDALVRATGRRADELSGQLDDGPTLDPDQAVALGLLDPPADR
jgi:ATP-dependent Clp protease, protease subunit